MSAFAKARASEAASKESLRLYGEQRGWKVAFFEGVSGAPRTGIIDAIAYRLARRNADALEVRLVQLKGGDAGVTAGEIARLKKAVDTASVKWLIAAFDGDELHLVPDDRAEAVAGSDTDSVKRRARHPVKKRTGVSMVVAQADEYQKEC